MHQHFHLLWPLWPGQWLTDSQPLVASVNVTGPLWPYLHVELQFQVLNLELHLFAHNLLICRCSIHHITPLVQLTFPPYVLLFPWARLQLTSLLCVLPRQFQTISYIYCYFVLMTAELTSLTVTVSLLSFKQQKGWLTWAGKGNLLER